MTTGDWLAVVGWVLLVLIVVALVWGILHWRD